MYVDPFWFGVLTTVVVEIVLLFVAAIYMGGKNK